MLFRRPTSHVTRRTKELASFCWFVDWDEEMTQFMPYREPSAIPIESLLQENPSEAPLGIGQQASNETIGIEFSDLSNVESNSEFFDWNGYFEVRFSL